MDAGPDDIFETILALYWRALTIEELAHERDLTTSRAFRAVREAIGRGWVEPYERTHTEGGTLRLYRLSPEGCVKLAPLVRTSRPVMGA